MYWFVLATYVATANTTVSICLYILLYTYIHVFIFNHVYAFNFLVVTNCKIIFNTRKEEICSVVQLICQRIPRTQFTLKSKFMYLYNLYIKFVFVQRLIRNFKNHTSSHLYILYITRENLWNFTSNRKRSIACLICDCRDLKVPMKRKFLFDIFVDIGLKFRFLLLKLNIAPFYSSKISVKQDKSYATNSTRSEICT